MMKKQDRIWKFLFFSLLLVLFFLFYFIIIKMPLMGEDFALRTTNIYTSATISEIINKIISQMSGWNMRIGEQISIFFCSIDKSIFNLLNPMLTVLYFYLFYVFCEGSLTIKSYKKAIFVILLAFSLIFLCMPVIGELFFWLTGSCNYFWACMIVLLFLIPYRLYLFNERIEFSRKKQIYLILYTVFFGFFSGMSNENVSGTLLVMLTILLVARKFIFHRKNPIWSYIGFGSLIVGTTVLLTAPSTALRIKFYNEIYQVKNVTMETYISRIENIIQSFFSSNSIIILFCISVIMLIIWVFNWKRKKIVSTEDNKNTWICLFFLIVGILSVGAIVLTPYVEKRSFLFFMTLWFMFVIRLSMNYFSKYEKIFIIVGIFIFSFSMLTYRKVYSEYSHFSREWEEVDTVIKSAYYNGQTEVIVKHPNYGDSRILYYNGIGYLKTNSPYQQHFYGINIIFQ